VEYLEPVRGSSGARVPLANLPVISFGRFRHGNFDVRVRVAKEIGEACRNIGAFYIVDHGMSDELIARTFAEVERFFALPPECKAEIAIERSDCHRGYFMVGGKRPDPGQATAIEDYKEGIKIGRDLSSGHPLVRAGIPMHGPNQWPRGLPGWEGAMRSYLDAVIALGNQIMRAFALSLDLDECFFDAMLTEPMISLGPLHYPPQQTADTENRIGAHAHTDFGCVTILAQDRVGGLQVRNVAGDWIDAPPVADSLVINIGDMMARWTNDVFTPANHRVISAAGVGRYSIATFFDPDYDADLSVLPTCTGPHNPPRYPPTTAGRSLLGRVEENFAYHRDLGAAG
jgi:isopenicillin N synthase-like dioxygenase